MSGEACGSGLRAEAAHAVQLFFFLIRDKIQQY